MLKSDQQARSMVRWGKQLQMLGIVGWMLGFLLFWLSVSGPIDADAVVHVYVVGTFQGASVGLSCVGGLLRFLFRQEQHPFT